MNYDRQIDIRRRDGSIFKVIAPPWHDADSVFTNDGAMGLMPNIFIVHQKHPPMKLNVKTRQFEICNPMEIPAMKAMPELKFKRESISV